MSCIWGQGTRCPRHLLLFLLVAAVAAGCGASSSTDGSEAGSQSPAHLSSVNPPASIKSVLDGIRRDDTGQLAVSEEDGRFLRVLVAAANVREAIEVGGASGYSAIWIGLGLRETGGRLTTIEYDPERASEAAANIEKAGLSDIVRVVAGDAFREIPEIEGSFDFVFLDAWKRDYARFLEILLPRMKAGGLFLAHNVINKRDEMPDFLAAIEANPLLFTTIVSPSGEGISVSYKRR